MLTPKEIAYEVTKALYAKKGQNIKLDYGSIVVHVFTEEARKFYDLERLWADAETVDIRDIIIEEN